MSLVDHANTPKEQKRQKGLGSGALVQRRPQKFFLGGGGKGRIHYLMDQIKPFRCNQKFAMGLEPKFNMILLKKCCCWAAC